MPASECAPVAHLHPSKMLEWARAILDCVRTLDATPRIVAASDAIILPGPPNGEPWRIRMYRNGRGKHHLNVKVPGLATPRYCVRGVINALIAFGVELPDEMNYDDDDSLGLQELLENDEDAEVEVEDAHVEVTPPNPIAYMAGYRINVVIRAYLLWKRRAYVRRMENELARVTQDLYDARVEEDTAMERMTVIAMSEMAYRNLHPDVNLLPTVTFISDLRMGSRMFTNIQNMMTQVSGLTRNMIDARASELVRTFASTTLPHRCGRAHLRLGGHGAIVVGDLPLHLPPFIACELMGQRMYVSINEEPDDAWIAVTTSQFGEPWTAHMSNLGRTDVTFITLFTDIHRRNAVGAMAFSRKVARKASVFYPVVIIESIASREMNQGTGKKMFEFSRNILFSDTVGIHSGLIFAQCVRIPFWPDRMDETREAKSLIMQMEMLYQSYSFEPHTSMRSAWVTMYDDMPSPAPTHVVA